MVAKSGIIEEIVTNCVYHGKRYVLYGDQGYGRNDAIQCPIKKHVLNPSEALFNVRMSSVRQCIEWAFNDVISLWKALDWVPQQRILKTHCAAWYVLRIVNVYIIRYACKYIDNVWYYSTYRYRTCVFFTNCHSCLNNRNQTAEYFGLPVFTLQQYVHCYESHICNVRDAV